MIQLTLTLKMTTAGVVEPSVTVNNSPIQDYDHPNDYASPNYEMTPGFKFFTLLGLLLGTGKTNSPISEWATPNPRNIPQSQKQLRDAFGSSLFSFLK